MISLDNLKTAINAIKCLLNDYPKKKDIPTKLPNPNPLTFTGVLTGSYDGSEALTVEIPSGGTSDHRQLTNRDAENQHPITAITGLQTALDGKQPSGDYATSGELDALADIVDGKADATDIPSLEGYATEAYVQNYHDNTKQDIITDLASIRSGAALGATALQSVPNTYRTAAQQDIIDNGKQPVGDYALRSELFSGNYNDLTNKPTIPSAVTESTVSGWGFTKNTGTYSKPSTGIPKTDLASAVQTSLGKADTALQQHQDISGKENTSNKVTTISSASTNTQYPSAKAVYDFFASLDGNGVAY